MGVYKQRGSPFWYISFMIDGKRYTESTKSESKTFAQKVLAKRKAEALDGRYKMVKSKEQISFKDFVTKFLDWSKANKRSYERDVIFVNHFLKFFGNKKLSEISTFNVEGYKIERKKQVSPATVNRELACLKRIYNLAIAWKKANANPVEDVKFLQEPNEPYQWLDKDEINKLIEACDEHLRPLVIVGCHTGLRSGILKNLKWSQIDFNQKLILAEKTKTNKIRYIPMNKTVIETLQKLERIDEYVFHSRKGRWKNIQKAFDKAVKKSGIKGMIHGRSISPHAMRHSFASHLVMDGTDLISVKELLGHSSLEMTMRYAHLAPEHKQKAVERFAENLLYFCYNESQEIKVVSVS